MAYVALTTASLTHRDLLLDAGIVLPLLQVRIDLAGFFTIAPAAFALLHLMLVARFVLLARKALSLHGLYYYVPDLLKHFTTAQINALIAPRAHLGLAGLRDKLTPVEGLDVIDGELQQVLGAQ